MATRKNWDLRNIVFKETSHVQETFRNVHFFKLEEPRIKELEYALKVDAEREILFRSGSVVVTLQFRNRREHLVKRRRGKRGTNSFFLGIDEYPNEYTDVVPELIIGDRIRNYPSDTYVIRARSDKAISWRTSHLAFQAIYIYSDVVASQVVGDDRANLLRVIVPKRSHGMVISENFVHLFYNDVRVKSFNTNEIL